MCTCAGQIVQAALPRNCAVHGFVEHDGLVENETGLLIGRLVISDSTTVRHNIKSRKYSLRRRATALQTVHHRQAITNYANLLVFSMSTAW
jgi:hypothetical protein